MSCGSDNARESVARFHPKNGEPVLKALVYEKHGNPAEVLQVRELPAPKPGFREVRVRMLASPINPSDLYTILGLYGVTQQLPATPGYEGVGIVEENGGGVLGWLRKGKRVAVIHEGGGAWAEQVVVPARRVFPVPDNVPDEQAATFFVNPATALVMTRHVLRVPQSQWLLQSAAGSALGKMVIRLGKLYGFRTINVVRRPEQVEELKELGADEVVCDSREKLVERVMAITQGQGVRYAIDPVGGETGTCVVECLGRGGRALLYGLLSGRPIQVDPRQMITNGNHVAGFWLSIWLKKQGVLTMLRLFRQVRRLMSEGVLQSDIAAIYTMDEIQKAATHVQGIARGGKIVLKIGS